MNHTPVEERYMFSAIINAIVFGFWIVVIIIVLAVIWFAWSVVKLHAEENAPETEAERQQRYDDAEACWEAREAQFERDMDSIGPIGEDEYGNDIYE